MLLQILPLKMQGRAADAPGVIVKL